MPARRCWGVIPAAGIGSRMGGDTPKQYLQVAGATVLEHSLGALLECAEIAAVVVALHPEDSRPAHMACFEDERVIIAPGGAERSDSVLAGLEALAGRAGDSDWVLVHDAARPCIRGEDIRRLMAEVNARNCGGILAQPVNDTVKRARDDRTVEATLDRSRLWRAQTPQMFPLGLLRDALAQARERGGAVTDEASAMEMAGHPVLLVPGSPGNLKITLPADLPLAAWYLGHPEGV